MRPHEAALRRVTESVAFRASSAGYLVVDCDLNIRAANPSYEQATLHRGADMIGEFVFDVFPDNPDAPEAHSVRNLESSLVSVLRNAGPHRMRLQRYDVLGPYTGTFVKKTWLPVNSPIFDSDGHTIGILHHVEDVSHLVVATSLERLLSIPAGTATTEADHIADARRFAERARRDAVLRRQGADALFARSVRAVDRSARSMSAMGSRSLGPARQQINGFRRLGR